MKKTASSIGMTSVDDINTWYMTKQANHRILTPEETRKLIARYQDLGDNKALEMLIKHNQRLIISIAMRFKRGKAPFMDLVQQGNLGLIKAIERFDSSLDTAFSSYATIWIMRMIRPTTIAYMGLVSQPEHIVLRLSKLRSLMRSFRAENNRDPDEEEQIDLIVSNMGESSVRAKKLLAFKTHNEYSLDNCMTMHDDNDERTWHEFTPSTSDLSPMDIVDARMRFYRFKERLQDLVLAIEKSVEEGLIKLEWRNIFFSYFALNGYSAGETLESVGKRYRITRERVRQIVSRDLWKKIRKSRDLMKYKELVHGLASLPVLEDIVGEKLEIVQS